MGEGLVVVVVDPLVPWNGSGNPEFIHDVSKFWPQVVLPLLFKF